MALMMALDQAETQNRLDSLDQVVDSLWYPLTTGLSVISLHSQECSGMTVGLVPRGTEFESTWPGKNFEFFTCKKYSICQVSARPGMNKNQH